jgi:hypothetical protein
VSIMKFKLGVAALTFGGMAALVPLSAHASDTGALFNTTTEIDPIGWHHVPKSGYVNALIGASNTPISPDASGGRMKAGMSGGITVSEHNHILWGVGGYLLNSTHTGVITGEMLSEYGLELTARKLWDDFYVGLRLGAAKRSIDMGVTDTIYSDSQTAPSGGVLGGYEFSFTRSVAVVGELGVTYVGATRVNAFAQAGTYGGQALAGVRYQF